MATSKADWRKELEKRKRQEWNNAVIGGVEMALRKVPTNPDKYYATWVDPVSGKRMIGQVPVAEVYKALEQQVRQL